MSQWSDRHSVVHVYTVWVKKKFTPRKMLIILKFIYEKWIIIHLLKECFIPNHLVPFVCGICSRSDEQEALLYQMIWSKTLFHKMYNNLLFIDDFKNN